MPLPRGGGCETNNDNCGEFTREGDSRREGAPRRRHFSTRTRKNCGAVDGPATLAANPRESLPSFPSGPPVAFAPTPRAQLTHNRWSKKPSNQPTIQRQLPFLGYDLPVAASMSDREYRAYAAPAPCPHWQNSSKRSAGMGRGAAVVYIALLQVLEVGSRSVSVRNSRHGPDRTRAEGHRASAADNFLDPSVLIVLGETTLKAADDVASS